MNLRAPISTAAALAVVAVAPVRAQQPFEGTITFEMTGGPEGQQNIQYSVKGDKVRMDMSAQGMEMFTLYDLATKTMDMVMPAQKMYLERPVDTPKPANVGDTKSKIEWTGQKETIAGYECEHANITDDNGATTDVCLAKGLGPFVGMRGGPGGPGGRMGARGGAMGGRMGGGMRQGPGMASGWERDIGQAFPLKVTRNGNVEMQVTSIEKKSLDDALFTIPEGYQKMGMPGGGPGGS